MNTFFELIRKVKSEMIKQNFLALVQNGNITKVPFPNLFENINSVASYLVYNNFKKQDKLIIMLESSPAWIMTDLACIVAGGVSVPMFSNLSFENMVYQFQNCEAEFICIPDEATFNIIKKTGHHFRTIFTLKPFSSDFLERYKEYNIVWIEDAIKEGASRANETKDALAKIENETDPSDTATIIYTSGTSGRPKGVELTHRNIMSQIDAVDVGYKDILNPMHDTVFSFLPLAHIFQRTVSYYFLAKGVSAFFSNDIKTIADDLNKIKPAVVGVVPRFLEKVKNGLAEKIKNEPSFVKKFLGKLCYNYAKNHEPTMPHSILYKVYDKLLYSKVREKLGGSLKAMICGGAALPDEVYRFFINLGFPLLQGYGLTETSPVVAVNTLADHKIYTIGKAMKDIEVKLTADGELLVKGPNVMKGYYKMNNEGARVIDENGFLATGDIASIDSEGYIKIIGRKKEQFKTSNGKFINPIKIESMLNAIPFIETSCVIAEGKSFVTVILFPNEAGIDKIAEIEASLPTYIRQINEQLDRHENIHYFYLNDKPATIENGQITPSMKIIRKAIEEQFKNVISDFYSRKF